MGDLRRRAPLLALAIVVGLPGIAWAKFQVSTTAATSTWTTLSVAAATGLTATPACRAVVLIPQVTLTWTPSSTSRLTAQVVLRRTGTGAFTTVATLGPTATSYSDSSLLSLSSSYTYEIRSAVNGFTTDTSPVTATTPAVCL